jgi:hypothetical protein
MSSDDEIRYKPRGDIASKIGMKRKYDVLDKRPSDADNDDEGDENDVLDEEQTRRIITAGLKKHSKRDNDDDDDVPDAPDESDDDEELRRKEKKERKKKRRVEAKGAADDDIDSGYITSSIGARKFYKPKKPTMTFRSIVDSADDATIYKAFMGIRALPETQEYNEILDRLLKKVKKGISAEKEAEERRIFSTKLIKLHNSITSLHESLLAGFRTTHDSLKNRLEDMMNAEEPLGQKEFVNRLEKLIGCWDKKVSSSSFAASCSPDPSWCKSYDRVYYVDGVRDAPSDEKINQYIEIMKDKEDKKEAKKAAASGSSRSRQRRKESHDDA